MKHILVIVLGALTLCLVFGTGPTKALEELKVYRGILILEGKIVSGDYDKIRKFLGTKSIFDKISGGVFIASPGGEVGEAMKIGRLIRALRLSTDAPSGRPSGSATFGEARINANHLVDARTNYQCASACFLVYVSGIYRSLKWTGRLGVHRPTRKELLFQTRGVEDVIALDRFVRKTMENYLEEMNVPAKYVDLMFSTSPNEMRWITQDEFVSDLGGFIPELRNWVDTKCGRSAREEKFIDGVQGQHMPQLKNAPPKNVKIVLAQQSSEVVECWMQSRTELPIEAWPNVFASK